MNGECEEGTTSHVECQHHNLICRVEREELFCANATAGALEKRK
jgi:hypothetical protein